MPKSALFYSTNREWAWGAPDYVWPRAAEVLLRKGVAVVAVVHPDALEREEIQQLRAQGATILRQPPRQRPGGRLTALRGMLSPSGADQRRFIEVVSSLDSAHAFINQGGTYDIMAEPDLLRWLQESEATTYDLFCHSNMPQGPLDRKARERRQVVFKKARRCFFNSRWMRDLTELQLLTRFENADFFSLLIRFDHERPMSWPPGAPTEENPLRLASVSRIDCHHKGLDVLLQGLSCLSPDLPSWRMSFYGQGPDREYLESLTRSLGLSNRVTFHGHQSDVHQIWQENHLLVLVSRYEGLGVSMLEAMACGRPVLRTPYGGAAEWIVAEETGYLCPAAEPELIARSLSDALTRNSQWKKMGQAAHRLIRERYNAKPWDVYLAPFDFNPNC